MKSIIKYAGTLSIVILCLSLMAVPAAALGESTNASSTPASYGYYNPSNGFFAGYDWSRTPGSTQICRTWIPGHRVPVKVMMPGRWEYRRVWIPGYPTTRYRWVPGFWQTTSYHSRPDVNVWGSPRGGGYGMPYQNSQSSRSGYFNQYGMWIPTQK